MRTTVTLDDDVYEAARAHAEATGQPLGRALSELVRQALQPSRKESKRAPKKTSRFPAFEVPVGTPMIPASRIQKALAEEEEQPSAYLRLRQYVGILDSGGQQLSENVGQRLGSRLKERRRPS